MKACLILAAVGLIGACGDDSSKDDVNPVANTAAVVEPFIALERDFKGFEKWDSFALGMSPAMGTVHVAGKRSDFLNRRPPAGATTFPVGTIVVKVIEPMEPGGTGQIFAMVKRGGGYNDEGAVGWEWFELEVNKGQAPIIAWRGTSAPTAEKYGGEKVGTCNACHTVAHENDFIQAPPLNLKTLSR